MRPCSAVILLVAIGLSVALPSTTYHGHSVVRVLYPAVAEHQLRQVVQGLDVWLDARGRMDVRVKDAAGFLDTVKTWGLNATVMVQDVQRTIDEQAASVKSHAKSDRTIDSTTYRDFNQLQNEMDDLQTLFPKIFSTYTAGITHMGRVIRVAKVSSGGHDLRPAVWIDCGIHAREWVTQASCMYFLDQLTAGYGTDEHITNLVDTYDFHVLPVTNPDGYVYSWHTDRMWRKNRVPYSSRCYGADCNRNFDSNFGGPGASAAPCSESYHGPSAFSEAESTAIRQASSALGSRLKGFFSLHSYSQYWMTPYGYTSRLPPQYTEMMRVTHVGVAALQALYGTKFVSGNIAHVIYLASGGSIDWVYDSLGVVYSFAIELRDKGLHGFMLPENQIKPTAEETWAGITAAINAFA